jgi:flagellar M-ring protein FliF
VDQLKQIFQRLSIKQRISIAMALTGVCLAVVFLSRWVHERDYRSLFTSLTSEDAGAIVRKLKESGVDYRLDDNGGSVLVPSARVSEMRLELASAGIPKSGRIGFELFDKTNLGVTDFTEHVNYRRALEGELERSVTSLSEVEQARVHLTFPKESVFTESRQPGKASVLIKLRAGRVLGSGNVMAISHLVASAVEGLQPESVAVLDMHGNLLSRPVRSTADPSSAATSDANIDYRQRIEKLLLEKINSTLDPLLGSGHYRATVSAECNFSSGEESRELFEPEKSVMVSSRKTEDVNSAAATAGVPGTTSNLPRAPRPSGTGSGFVRRTEDIEYQTSRTVRRMQIPTGSIERLSVAVLVDHHVGLLGSGDKAKRTVTPASPEELNTIRQLVTAAVGLNTTRGDQLVVESSAFDATQNPEPLETVPSQRPVPDGTRWEFSRELVRNGAAFGILLVVGLAVAAWIYHSKKTLRRRIAQQARPELATGSEASLAAGQSVSNAGLLGAPNIVTEGTARTEALLQQIRNNLSTDANMCAQVLRVWLQDEKQA